MHWSLMAQEMAFNCALGLAPAALGTVPNRAVALVASMAIQIGSRRPAPSSADPTAVHSVLVGQLSAVTTMDGSDAAPAGGVIHAAVATLPRRPRMTTPLVVPVMVVA